MRSKKAVVSYIGLGSNVGDRIKKTAQTLKLLSRAPKIRIEKISSLYMTDPVGGPPQRTFLNGVVKIKTTLSPADLLIILKRIERQMKRQGAVRWGPRTIDLDILTYGRKIVRSPHLTIPHPRYHTRRFVLIPLVELAPNLRHPVLKRSNSQLLRELTLSGQRVTIHALWRKSRFYPFKNGRSTKSPSPR